MKTDPNEIPASNSAGAATAIFEDAVFEDSRWLGLLRSLESLRSGLACEWARQTMIAALPHVDEPNRKPLDSWLSVLPTLIDEGNASQLGHEARRIWYAFPRTDMQTAVSKLFEAAGTMLVDNNSVGYKSTRKTHSFSRKTA